MKNIIKKPKFAKEASNEFLDAVEWYEARSKGPGLRGLQTKLTARLKESN